MSQRMYEDIMTAFYMASKVAKTGFNDELVTQFRKTADELEKQNDGVFPYGLDDIIIERGTI